MNLTQPSHQRRRRTATVAAVIAAALVVAGSTARATTAPVDDTTGDQLDNPAISPVVSEDEMRAGRAGLGWFLLANVDRPTRIADPCPMLGPDSVAWYLAAHELVASDREAGVRITWDSDVGGGLILLACGVDLDASLRPEGSVAWSLQATLLDGQATFTQYAVDLAGRDVVIERVPDQRAQLVVTCSDNGRRCTTALEIDDLVLTLRLRGLPSDVGPDIARALAFEILREVIGNLGAVRPPR